MVVRRKGERGFLMVEASVAMAVIVLAMMPLAFCFTQERALMRGSYNRAVAMEIVDGELEVLVAGEWRSYQPGTQDFVPHDQAVQSLPPGKFQLIITGQHVKLEWLPADKGEGGAVTREGTAR
jgi:hypothetical protein